MSPRLVAWWSKRRVTAALARLGLTVCSCTASGAGGDLATYVISARGGGSRAPARYLVKCPGSASTLARRLATTPQAMLDAEWRMTQALSAAGLGPPGVARGDDLVVREYWDATPLARLLATASPAELAGHLAQALRLLERILAAAQAQGLVCHIDFKPGNILRAPDGRFFVVDHEWSVLKYRTAAEMEQATVAGFLGGLLAALPGDWSADMLFDQVARAGFPQWSGDAMRDRLALGYYGSTSAAFMKRLLASDDLKRRLAGTGTPDAPKAVLQTLGERLNARGVRWCFQRSYRRLWASDDYRERDIDLYLHPDDLLSFTDAALSQGFACFRENQFIRYCPATQQCLMVSIDLIGLADDGDMNARALLDRRRETAWRRHLDDADQIAVYIVNAVRATGRLKESYREEIAGALGGDAPLADRLRARLACVWPPEVAHEVAGALAAARWDAAMHAGRTAERATGSALGRLTALARTLVCSGPRVVAFLGVDGAGKSTSLRRTVAALRPCRIDIETLYLGGYYPPTGRAQSYVLPTDRLRNLASLLLRRKSKPGATASAASPPPSPAVWVAPGEQGGLARRLALAAFGLVLVLDSYLLSLKLRLSMRGDFIVTDRYFYDLIIYFGADHPWSRLVARLRPPDRALFFYADPAVQVRREPRHSVAEITTNQAQYRRVPVWNRRIDWVEVCTELPLEVTIQQVMVLCLGAPSRFSLVRLASAAAAFLGRRCARWFASAPAAARSP